MSRTRSAPLGAKIVLYLVLVHVLLGAIGLLVLAHDRTLLLVVEALFVVSIVVGILLVRSFFLPLAMIRTGAELIQEGDFTAHFREVGQREMDDLIRIYNKMIDRLREERLRVREQHTFLEEVLRASPAGVITLDFDGKVALVNPSAARLLGVDGNEVLGRALGDVDPFPDHALGALPVGRSEILALHGRRLKCARAEFYDRGFPRSFFVFEELTEELRASEKGAYEKIIRVLSHEVNNSVGAVSSLLESVLGYEHEVREEHRADYRGALEVAIARMRHLDAFMRGFADVVRIPAPHKQPCSLERLLDEIAILMRPELERRRIVLRRSGAQTQDVLVDKNQIEQVLVNVLKNAIEAIGEDGKIEITLAPERGRPLLVVRDSGSGIPAEARDHLFTPFFSTKRDGRGLGLTVVREILSQHRCDYSLASHPEGGAEFRIRFDLGTSDSHRTREEGHPL